MKTIMNKSLVLLGVGALMLGAVSCDDFLNTPPVDKQTGESFYRNAMESEQAVIGVYSGLRDMANDEYLYLSEMRSDNMWAEPEVNGVRPYSEISNFRSIYTLAEVNDVWVKWYDLIYNANKALALIPEADFVIEGETLRNQLINEVRFLRGWAYFELVRLYGNVPLIKLPSSPQEVNNTPQSTARQVYDEIIIPDLKAALALPLAADMKDTKGASIAAQGRADRMAAQAMLARVYMTMAGFPLNDAAALPLAEEAIDAVIAFSEANSNKYWAPNITEWRKQWMPDYNNRYSIFAIQYRMGGTGNGALFNFSPSLPASYTSRRLMGNSVWVEKSLMYEFSREYNGGVTDGRGDGYSILLGYDAEPPAYEDPYTQQTDTLNVPGVGVVNDVYTRTMFYKFMPSKRKLTALGMNATLENGLRDDYDWPVNLPILRYEDILLMKAEILAGRGDATGALNIVNRIRTRAEIDDATGDAMAAVKRERRVEMMGEGVRWFDLVRWNEWKQAVTTKFARYNNPAGTNAATIETGHYLYPIPMTQMQTTPGLYNQNDGY